MLVTFKTALKKTDMQGEGLLSVLLFSSKVVNMSAGLDAPKPQTLPRGQDEKQTCLTVLGHTHSRAKDQLSIKRPRPFAFPVSVNRNETW